MEKKHLNQSKSLQQAGKSRKRERERGASTAVVEKLRLRVCAVRAGAVCISVQDGMGQIGWLMGIITPAFPAMKGGGEEEARGKQQWREECGGGAVPVRVR